MAGELHPFDESFMPAEQPPSLAEIVLDERHLAYARRRWADATPAMQEYRMRQAIWARFQMAKPHPDDPNRRLLGGPQPNSGPKRTKRIGAALVEEAQRRSKEVVDAAFAPLAEGQDPMVRHRAAMNIAKHEREERAMDIVEDDYTRKTTDEIRKEAASVLAEMVRNGELDPSALDIVDADVVDESQKALSS